ncbi:MAG: hypothetical protein GQ474_07975 [Sulfurimonas sp.]|nr:hypothetical protein [Sulfurimonas sp.]
MYSLEDFEEKYMPIPETGCWEWLGYCNKKGYGVVTINGSSTLAHRVSYQLKYGGEISGLCVCHTCDNPSCGNPEHLWVGTNQDNMDDKVKKGRQSRMFGESNPSHNPTIFTFEHVGGKVFKGTQAAFLNKVDVEQSAVSRLISGVYKSTRGWSLNVDS